MPSARTLELLKGRVVPEVRDFGLGHFDREGEPITMGQWVALRELPDYFRVALTELDLFHVSTVWLGLDHGFGLKLHAPIIFESMVFANEVSWSKPWSDEQWGDWPTFPFHKDHDQRRYSTEEQALAGHEELVAECRAIEELMKSSDPRDLGA